MSSRVEIEKSGNRIHITGWIGPNTPEMCKAVGGGRFSKEGGPHWTFPLDLSVCRSARRIFGQRMAIGPELNAWAKAAIAQEAAVQSFAKGDRADLRWTAENAPTAHAAMLTRPYQTVAARWGAEVGSFLLADQPGLGKTVETLSTIIEHTAYEPGVRWHLIFAPSRAILGVWAPEVAQWLPESHAEVIPLTGSLAQRAEVLANFEPKPDTRHVFVVGNIEVSRIKATKNPKTGKNDVFDRANAVLPGLFTRVWDTIVVDESHRALIRRTGTPSQQRAGFIRLVSQRRIALSGTPMRGKPEQLWGTLNWLRPDLYTSYWTWVGRYWKLQSNGFSEYVLGPFQDDGEDRLAADLRGIMLRRTKAEVLPELPPKQYAGTYLVPGDDQSPHGVWLDMSPAQRKQFEAFCQDATLEFEGGGELIANGVLSEYTRRKQLSSAVHKLNDAGHLVPTLDSPKFEWLVDFIEQLDGERVVVVSQFTQLIDCFAAGLAEAGVESHVLTGKTSLRRSEQMVADFQSDTPSKTVFFLNTQAGGVSLTLDAADYLVLLDETTIPDDQEQVEDRIHRTSRMHNVTIYYLRTLDTQDEEVAWVAAARESVQKYLLDGARGVNYAKALYLEKKENAK